MKQGAPEQVPGPGEALLRGAGEVRRAAALGAAAPPSPGSPRPAPRGRRAEGRGQGAARERRAAIDDWDVPGARTRAGRAREAGARGRRAARLLPGPASPSRRAATPRRWSCSSGAGVEDKPGSYLRLAKDTLAITRGPRARGERALHLLLPEGQGRGAGALRAGDAGGDPHRRWWRTSATRRRARSASRW